MATDRRRAVATATSGAALTTAGGVLRHRGVEAANRGKIPEFDLRHPRRWAETHPTRALLRTGARGRKRYLLGASLGLVGAPALAVGIHDSVIRKEPAAKRLKVTGLVGEAEKIPTPGRFAGALAGSGAGGLHAPYRLPASRVPTKDELDEIQRQAKRFKVSGTNRARKTTRTEARRAGEQDLHEQRWANRQPNPYALRSRTRSISKRDGRHSFVEEGLAGTGDALHQRAEGIKEVPPQHRAGPLAVSAGAGLVGSLAAHRGLDRVKSFQGARHGARAGITALAGTTLAGASYPLARHTVRSSEYEVTPAGVRRRKKPAIRPSSKAKVYDSKRMSRRDFRNATVGEASKVHNPHSLTPVTSRGTTRKVHWLKHGTDRAVCGLDGAFGRGTGPFAEHYGEITCQGCLRTMRIRKAGDYPGRRTKVATQRAAILAAGATPVVGSVAGARTAGHFAPPGERLHTETRQYGLTAAGSAAGGVAGAYGTAALASRHAGVARATERAAEAHGRAKEKVLNLKPVNAAMARLPKGGRTAARVARAKEAAGGLKLAGPLKRSPIAALVGYGAGKTIGGYTGSGIAMRRNQSDQKAYNLKHPVTKYVENMTVAERRKLSRKKRIAATSSTTTGLLGLGALAARARGKSDLALNMLTGSAAIGGANNLNFAGVLRREARAQSPDTKKVHKGALVAKADTKHMAWHSGGSACGLISAPKSRLTTQWSKVTCSGCRKTRWLFNMGKADRREPLTRMRADQASDLVRRHGDAGPLPSNLSRSERMQAYEARYVHAGGHKAEHWQRRADRGDKVKVAGLAGATLGGAGIMALRHPRVARALGHRVGAARHATDTATIGAATVSGAGELYAGHARRRRASYSNSKAGVAASALRRMKDYQP